MSTLARIQITSNYVSTLRSETGYYIGYIPNEFADQMGADGYSEIIRKDLEIKRCINLLSLMAAGESVKIETKNPKYKELAEFALSNVEDFLHARKSLIEKGVLFGLGIQRKYYEKEKYHGLQWEVCTKMQEVDRRRMRIERDDEDKNKLYWTIWCPIRDAYIILEDRADNPKAAPGCAVQDYSWYIHEHEETSPYFEGLGDALYNWAYIKSKVVQYWADLSESWAKPFLTIMVDAATAAFNAALGSGSVTSTQRVRDLLDTFEKARARHMAVIDKSDQIEFHEHGSAGNNIIRELLEYCDKAFNLLILGAELTTSTPSIGSYALGTVHKQSTDTIINYNRMRLCGGSIKKDLIYDFFYRNIPQVRALGLTIPRRNEISVKIEVETEELQKQAEAAKAGGKQVSGNKQDPPRRGNKLVQYYRD